MSYRTAKAELRARPKQWLVTGAAGFIGSNLVERLLTLGQQVVGLDNFATGHRCNLREIEAAVSPEAWSRFKFEEGDIRSLATCRAAVAACDYVLHHAALGPVPRSIDDPITTNAVNIGGFPNMLVAARDASVRRFVYATSSSTYGDRKALPKVEHRIGRPLSPYAVTKHVDELYALAFAKVYGMDSIGLRYFNVFGPRQDPDGAFAAVIPKWIAAMLNDQPVLIFGDGEASCDFCFVDNAVQANVLAAVAPKCAAGQVFDVALGQRTTLNELHDIIRAALKSRGVDVCCEAVHQDSRPGDLCHSQADISKACDLLGYEPTHLVAEGIEIAMPWYLAYFRQADLPVVA